MFIWLFGVEYPLAITPQAIADFKGRTGKCLIATCRDVRIEANRLVDADATNEEFASRMGRVIGYIDVSYMLHSVISQRKPEITIAEIQDAMLHVGDKPNELDSLEGRSECYTVVAWNLANLITGHFAQVASKKKSAADS
jgi:hypothetical protein